MHKKLIAVILSCWPIAPAWADPPALLRFIRDARAVMNARNYSDAKTTINVLGMKAVAGQDEAWLMELHDSFASIEEVDQALAAIRPNVSFPADGELLNIMRSSQSDLSRLPSSGRLALI